MSCPFVSKADMYFAFVAQETIAQVHTTTEKVILAAAVIIIIAESRQV